MPVEIEAKAHCASHDPIESRLEELGAEHIATILQHDTYFCAPHVDFAETDEALRVRREEYYPLGRKEDGWEAGGVEKRAFLTYKGPRLDETTKTREEVETSVAEPEEVVRVLRSVGFAPVQPIRPTGA